MKTKEASRQVKVWTENTTHDNISYIKYNISTEAEKSDLLFVAPIEQELSWHPECHDKMHGHNFNMILWIKEGKGMHYVDFDQHEVNGDVIFFLSPNNMHYYESISKQCGGYVIAFTTDFFEHIDSTIVNKMRHELFNNKEGANYCLVKNHINNQLQSYVNQMIEEVKNNGYNVLTNSILSSLLTLFLVTLRRNCDWNCKLNEVDRNTRSYKNYESFLHLVEKNYRCVHSAQDYAQELGISFCLLSKYTKEQVRQTPFEILTNRIMIDAKKMLRYSSLDIKEIAFKLGFNDQSYFIRYFRRNEGVAPVIFRNRERYWDNNDTSDESCEKGG